MYNPLDLGKGLSGKKKNPPKFPDPEDRESGRNSYQIPWGLGWADRRKRTVFGSQRPPQENFRSFRVSSCNAGDPKRKSFLWEKFKEVPRELPQDEKPMARGSSNADLGKGPRENLFGMGFFLGR